MHGRNQHAGNSLGVTAPRKPPATFSRRAKAKQNKATLLFFFFFKKGWSCQKLTWEEKEPGCNPGGSGSLTHPFFRPERLQSNISGEFKHDRTLIFVFPRPSFRGARTASRSQRKYSKRHLRAAEPREGGSGIKKKKDESG